MKFLALLALTTLTAIAGLECQAKYPPGYTWDFTEMFSTEVVTGQADMMNASVWEYRKGGDDLTRPEASELMQSYHHWEKVPGWQQDGRKEYMDRICRERWQAHGSAGGIQINWVSPLDGRVSVMVEASQFQGASNARTTFILSKNNEQLDAVSEGDNRYANSIGSIDVRRGDRISLRLATTGGWGWFSTTVFTVTLLEQTGQ